MVPHTKNRTLAMTHVASKPATVTVGHTRSAHTLTVVGLASHMAQQWY